MALPKAPKLKSYRASRRESSTMLIKYSDPGLCLACLIYHCVTMILNSWSSQLIQKSELMEKGGQYILTNDTEATPTLELGQDREVSLSELRLHGCSFLFCSSSSQPTFGVWKWFGQLVKLVINSCDMLIYWPEEEFQSLVSLKFFYISHCSKLIGPTKVKACCTRGRDQLLPNLKNVIIKCCERLIKLFVFPPSLTSIWVSNC